jgi:hypothetical protein
MLLHCPCYDHFAWRRCISRAVSLVVSFAPSIGALDRPDFFSHLPFALRSSPPFYSTWFGYLIFLRFAPPCHMSRITALFLNTRMVVCTNRSNPRKILQKMQCLLCESRSRIACSWHGQSVVETFSVSKSSFLRLQSDFASSLLHRLLWASISHSLMCARNSRCSPSFSARPETLTSVTFSIFRIASYVQKAEIPIFGEANVPLQIRKFGVLGILYHVY